MKKEIIYVGDPVCSWCYAFTDTFEKIREDFKEEVNFSYFMGGLIIDRELTLDKRVKKLLKQNWKEVEAKTGKHIKASSKIDDAEEIPYISDPAILGFLVMRAVDQDLAYKFYKKVHNSFYTDLNDIADKKILCEIAQSLGIEKQFFMDKISDNSLKELLYADKEKIEDLGVQAFPALVLKDESGTSVLNQGFKNYQLLKPQIESWLNGKFSADSILPVL